MVNLAGIIPPPHQLPNADGLYHVLYGIVSLPIAAWWTALSSRCSISPMAMIPASFTPLRHRIQNAIGRRFFRRKYDAQKVLAHSVLTARDETDLDTLTAELLRVVQRVCSRSSKCMAA